MTEYGRGPGSQPWSSDDPLYGDPGREGQHQAAGHDPYASDPYPPGAYPTDPYAPDPYAYDTQAQDPYAQARYAQGGYPDQGYDGGYGQDPYGHHAPPQGYQQPQWQGDTGQQPGYGQQQYGADGWQRGYPGGAPGDPYAGHAGSAQDPYDTRGGYYDVQDPYGTGQQPRVPHPGQQAGGPGGYPQGQPAGPVAGGPRMPRQPGPPRPAEPQQDGGPEGPDGAAEPDPEPEDDDPLDHPFFQDADGDRRGRGGDRDDDDGYDERRPAKRRSGTACLVVTLVLVAVVGGGGYYGYQFWEDHFGPPPDYSGDGTGHVQVVVPQGVSGLAIGQILQRAGVVKSSGAFVDAVNKSHRTIQPGTYTLRRQMSGTAAVRLMTNPASLNALIIGEGMRDNQIYAAIDKKIGVKPGTTKGVATKEAKHLGLPSWADDNAKIRDPLEGFLYPSRYSVPKGAKPADVLREMVAEAKKHYAAYDLKSEADKLGLKSPLQVVTVASLVQAEGKTPDDFRKMADVVYNRLKPSNTQTNGKLEFDSTYNYIKDQSKIDISSSEIKSYDNPYNTYYYAGLPPGPIGNPGDQALTAAMHPDGGGWFYFISLDCKKTTFTKTYAEHKKLVEKFDAQKKCN